MPVGDVTTTHVNGGLNDSGIKPDRIHAKVGIAEGHEENQVVIVRSFLQARQVFKSGPLVNSLQQHFEEFDETQSQKPAPVLCIRPANNIPGIATLVEDTTRVGKATVELENNPTGEANVFLKIVTGGKSEVATYKKSVDGGISWSAVMQTPVSGQSILLANDTVCRFTDDAVDPDATFVEGEIYQFLLQAPSASEDEILKSIALLKREYRLYWIHVIGGVDRAFAASVNQILSEMETEHHLPSFAILEAKPPTTEPTTKEEVFSYLQSLLDEFESFTSDRVSICAAFGRYIPGGIFAAGGIEEIQNAAEPIGYFVNCASLLSAKLAANPVNVSPSYVKVNRSLTLAEIKYWNLGYKDYLNTLNDSGFVTIREYDDYEGIFITKGKIQSKSNSDFREIPERRRADKLHRIVYKNSLPFLSMDSEIKSGSGGIGYIKQVCSSAVSSEMEVAGSAEISGHKIVLDPEKTFSKTKVLEAYLTMFVAGRIESISWTTSFAAI